jgi:hypothetical protein
MGTRGVFPSEAEESPLAWGKAVSMRQSFVFIPGVSGGWACRLLHFFGMACKPSLGFGGMKLRNEGIPSNLNPNRADRDCFVAFVPRNEGIGPVRLLVCIPSAHAEGLSGQ